MTDHAYALRIQFIGETVQSLFAADNKRMTRWIDTIIEQNNEALNWASPPNCFQHRGAIYRHSILPARQDIHRIGIPVIHIDLAPELLRYIDEKVILENDKTRIKQFLSVLLRPLVNGEQMRNAIPECLVRHSGYGFYKRTLDQKEVWQLTHDQIAEYHKLLPIMQMYDGASLLL